MAEIIAATEFGPGHVWLIFFEPVAEDASIYLSRDSDSASSLGMNGWQAQPYAITPLKVEKRGTGSRVLIGPDFVDYILDGEFITAKTGEQSFSNFWPAVVPAAKKGRKSIVERAKKAEKAPLPLEEKIDPEMEPEILAPITPPVDDVRRVVEAALAGQNKNEQDFSRLNPDKKGSMLPLIIIGIIIAAVLIGGIVFAMNHLGRDTAYERQTSGQEGNNTRSEPSQLDADFALGPDGWRRLITAPDTDPQRLFELGRALRQRQDGNTDIGFEAIYRALQKNNTPALEWYANANDPTSSVTGTNRITPPNIRRAFESWTTLAKQDPSMSAHVTKLCDYLRERRFSGTTEERTTFQDYCQ